MPTSALHALAEQETIGRVQTVEGSTFAIRADGSRVVVEAGMPLHQGDIVQTSDAGGVGIVLADGTALSMGKDARLVLDEMVYDPASQSGSVSLSVVEGVFTFVSGQIAKTDPDAMAIHGPSATIGIRGTQAGFEVAGDGAMTVVLMEEADGFVGEIVVSNENGLQVLNGANQATSIQSAAHAPSAVFAVTEADLLDVYTPAFRQLPTDGNTANDFGLGQTREETRFEETRDEPPRPDEAFADQAAADPSSQQHEASRDEIADGILAGPVDFETAAGQPDADVSGSATLKQVLSLQELRDTQLSATKSAAVDGDSWLEGMFQKAELVLASQHWERNMDLSGQAEATDSVLIAEAVEGETLPLLGNSPLDEARSLKNDEGYRTTLDREPADLPVENLA